jgi:hypothetical protein
MITIGSGDAYPLRREGELGSCYSRHRPAGPLNVYPNDEPGACYSVDPVRKFDLSPSGSLSLRKRMICTEQATNILK